ncbi:MAG: ABC transporter permease [Acetobacteraceae bacterium]
MGFLVAQALTALASASTLFLVAAGLTVIFGVTRVVNFAHGSLTMLGAYIAWTILGHLPRDPASFVLGVLTTVLVLAALGALLETVLLRRIYRAPELFQLLATFGVVLMVQDVTQRIWGPDDLALPRPPWMRGFVLVLGERFPAFDLSLIAIGPLVLAGLWLLLRRTRWGRLVRAATQDREMVAALGVDQRMLFTTVFALGAGLAGLAGALSLPDGSANLQIDLSVITEAFVVVVVGGMGSVPGAYLASLLIAGLQAAGIVFLPKITLVLVFLVMAVVLMLRPNGLLGRAPAPGVVLGAPPLVGPAPRALKLAGAALLLLAIAAPLFAAPYLLAILTEAAVAVLFAASLHFMMGPGGMPSFGHAAWFGIGAYAAGLATHALAAPMPLGLLLAPLCAGAAAFAFGAFVVRLSGIYLAMLTLAFAQIVWAIAFQADWTGGDNGILGVWPSAWAAGPVAYYGLTLALCAGFTLLLRRVLYAPLGYAIRATRDAPARAEAIGLNTGAFRLAAVTISGAAAGLAGGLFTYAHGSVFPTYISIPRSVDALLMVLLGGVQTIAGPVVGALAYTGLSDLLLRATDLWRFWLGALIVLLVLAFPEGIAGAVQRVSLGDGAALDPPKDSRPLETS